MLDLYRLGITQKGEPKDFNRLVGMVKHTWKRGDRRNIVTNIAKSEREGLDQHRQLRLNPGTPLQERRAYACNTAGQALALEAINVLTSTPIVAVLQREATPRVRKTQKAREEI